MSDEKKKRENLVQIKASKLIALVGENAIIPVSKRWIENAVRDQAMQKLREESEQDVQEAEEQEEQEEREEIQASVDAKVFDFNDNDQ